MLKWHLRIIRHIVGRKPSLYAGYLGSADMSKVTALPRQATGTIMPFRHHEQQLCHARDRIAMQSRKKLDGFGNSPVLVAPGCLRAPMPPKATEVRGAVGMREPLAGMAMCRTMAPIPRSGATTVKGRTHAEMGCCGLHGVRIPT
jgi:hypothetical protein